MQFERNTHMLCAHNWTEAVVMGQYVNTIHSDKYNNELIHSNQNTDSFVIESV